MGARVLMRITACTVHRVNKIHEQDIHTVLVLLSFPNFSFISCLFMSLLPLSGPFSELSFPYVSFLYFVISIPTMYGYLVILKFLFIFNFSSFFQTLCYFFFIICAFFFCKILCRSLKPLIYYAIKSINERAN